MIDGDNLGKMRESLKVYRSKLIDLSKRNPLINLSPTRKSNIIITEGPLESLIKGLSGDQGIELLPTVPAILTPFGDRDDYKKLSSGITRSGLYEELPLRLDPTCLSENVVFKAALDGPNLERTLSKVARDSKTAQAETGVNPLFCVIGILKWRESTTQKTWYHSPILIMPVLIEREVVESGERYKTVIKSIETEPEINQNLVEILKKNGYVLPPLEDNETGIDYIDRISTTMAKQGFEILNCALVTTLPAGSLVMWKDLDPSIWPGTILQSNRFLGTMLNAEDLTLSGDAIQFAEDYEVDKLRQQGKRMPSMIYDADSSQVSVLIDVADGKNIAIEGPPGTGKSQTIANMIADAAGEGKKILFVAEKQAALDVVASRLKKRGMENILFEYHSDSANKAKVIRKIKTRREASRPTASMLGQILGDINKAHQHILERSFYAGKEVFAGKSLNEVLWRIINLKIKLNEIESGLSGRIYLDEIPIVNHKMSELTNVIENYAKILEEAERDPHNPWKRIPITSSIDILAVKQGCSDLAVAMKKTRSSKIQLGDEIAKLVEASAIVAEEVVQKIESIQKNFTLDGPGLISAIDRYEENCRALADIQARDEIFNKLSREDIRIPRLSSQEVERICNLLKVFRVSCVKELKNHRNILSCHIADIEKTVMNLDPVLSKSGMDSPSDIKDTVRKLEDILSGEREPFSDDIIDLSFKNHDSEIRDKASVANNIKRNYKKLFLDVFTKEAIEDDNEDTDEKIKESLSVIEKTGIFQRISREYRDSLKFLQSKLVVKNTKAEDIQEIYSKAEKACIDFSDISERDFYPACLPEKWFAEENTDLDALLKEISEARKVNNILRAMALRGHEGLSREIYSIVASKSLMIQADHLLKKMDPLLPFSKQLEKEKSRLEEMNSAIEKAGYFPEDITVSDYLVQDIKDYEAKSQLVQERVTQNISKLYLEIEDAKYFKSLNLPWEYIKEIFSEEDVNLNLSLLSSKIKSYLRDAEREQKAKFNLGRSLGEEGLKSLLRGQPDDILAILDSLGNEEHSDKLQIMLNLSKAENLAKKFEVEEVVKNLLGEGVPAVACGIAYEYCILLASLRSHPDSIDLIQSQEGVDPQGIDDYPYIFRTKDEDLQKQTATRIVEDVMRNGAIKPGVSSGPTSGLTEGGLINKIVTTGTNITVRNLVERAGESLREMMPVWLMSPSSVAQIVPQTMQFDLVIIDEASQMRPESAIGSLLRAKQIVIVGDHNQMPPNRSFQVITDDEEDNEYIGETSESILDLANERLGVRRRLAWHYRSKHRSLIDFSNVEYYESKLILFPSSRDANTTLGVHSKYIPDGMVHDGMNIREAKELALAAWSLLGENPEMSIGIIALNSKQADFISRIMEEMALTEPTVRKAMEREDEPLIIRNLENIQGDERDIILISTVYSANGGTTASSILRSPIINREDGHRRLNVLFTRARSVIHLFTSLQPGHVGTSGRGHRAVSDLRKYLIYARTNEITSIQDTRSEPESDFEEAVGNAIAAAGYRVDYQIGVDRYWIDIGIKHDQYPYGYIVGVECDGATWHRGLAVRDRDRIRQGVLEGMGWTILRIWSTDWYRDPISEARKIVKKLDEIKDALVSDLVAEGFYEKTQSGERSTWDDEASDYEIEENDTLDPGVSRVLRKLQAIIPETDSVSVNYTPDYGDAEAAENTPLQDGVHHLESDVLQVAGSSESKNVSQDHEFSVAVELDSEITRNSIEAVTDQTPADNAELNPDNVPVEGSRLTLVVNNDKIEGVNFTSTEKEIFKSDKTSQYEGGHTKDQIHSDLRSDYLPGKSLIHKPSAEGGDHYIFTGGGFAASAAVSDRMMVVEIGHEREQVEQVSLSPSPEKAQEPSLEVLIEDEAVNKPEKLDPSWKKLETAKGEMFYESVRHKEYVVWTEDRGIVAKILAHHDVVRGRVEYVAMHRSDKEHHSTNLYEAVRWSLNYES